MSADALHMLLQGFGEVELHTKTVFLCVFANVSCALFYVCIFSVEGHIDLDSTVICAVPLLCKLDGLERAEVILHFNILIKGNDGASEVCLNTRLVDSFSNVVHKHIHIREGYDTATEHFRYCEHCAVVRALAVKIFFSGENSCSKPSIKRKVVAVATEKSHGAMAMCVVKAGDNEISVALDHLCDAIEIRVSTYVLDIFSVDEDIYSFVSKSVFFS